MPFYFALPRTGYTSNQGRQGTGRTEYLRTAPTNLTFTTSHAKPRNVSILRDNLHAIAMSAYAGEKSGAFDKAFITDTQSRLLYPSVPSSDTIAITLPKLSFRFETLTEAQADRLDELGMEERSVRGRGKVWVGALTTKEAKEVAKFGVVGSYAALGGTISMDGVSCVGQILRLITLSAQTLTVANGFGAEKHCAILETAAQTKYTAARHKCSDMTEWKKEESVSFSTHNTTTSILSRIALPKIYGNLDELSDLLSEGIFCPFEPNYSQSDRRAVHVLLSEFSCLSTEPDGFEIFDNLLTEMWTREICLCMEGEFLSHMIASLCLAKKIGSKICFLVTGNLYEGAILHGATEFSFKLVGGSTHDSLSKDKLYADIREYAFHSTTLRDILQEAEIGEDVDPVQIRSMRQLRTIIMGKKGHALTPQLQGSLAKKLLFLNFREKPEAVNPSTLAKFFSFIHPTSPMVIHEKIYMDRRAFFSMDTIEIALSMFGMYAPSPIISGRTLVLAVPPSSNKKTSNEPPSVQFCLKELSVSAKDWDGFIRGGAIVQPANKIRRGRRFAGSDKSEIWGGLTTLAASGLAAKRNEASANKVDRDVEKRGREEAQDPDNSRKKLRLDAIDFSGFEKASGGTAADAMVE